MPSAREIAEERFAKGEISEEEFERILSKLEERSNSEDYDAKESSSFHNAHNE